MPSGPIRTVTVPVAPSILAAPSCARSSPSQQTWPQPRPLPNSICYRRSTTSQITNRIRTSSSSASRANPTPPASNRSSSKPRRLPAAQLPGSATSSASDTHHTTSTGRRSWHTLMRLSLRAGRPPAGCWPHCRRCPRSRSAFPTHTRRVPPPPAVQQPILPARPVRPGRHPASR